MSDIIWILVPLAPFLMVSFIVWTKHQQKLAELQSQTAAEKAAQYAASNAELEQRVRVLERIVTDKGYDVSSQIEALRDARRVEALSDGREKEIR